jgi:hypothetical protein
MGGRRRKRTRDEWSRRDGESVPEYRYRLRLRVIRHYCGGKRIRCGCERRHRPNTESGGGILPELPTA